MLAVLDTHTSDALVLGWANDANEAFDVAMSAAGERSPDFVPDSVSRQPTALKYDPDIHTKAEVDAVNTAGEAWIVEWAEVLP
jgi:hypothetical protein